jgi:transcriptional antiterminator RfaH
MDRVLEWKLVYTKARCESWAEANLKNQGFSVLVPRVRRKSGTGFEPLFPRYVFIGSEPARDTRSVVNTRGVARLVHFGDHPVRVPPNVIDEVRSRMDAHGIVDLDQAAVATPLFDRGSRERLRALVKLAEAGFRVRAA